MDNLQVRLSEDFKLGWLACAIESEGSFQLAWGKRTDGYIQIVPRVNLGNKDQAYIDRVASICHDNGIPCYVQKRNSAGMKYTVWYGMKRVLHLLDLIEPYLAGKKDRAAILRQFVEYRLSGVRNRPYGPTEKDLFLRLRNLNGAGRIPIKRLRLAFERNPNDYTPDTAR